MRKIFNFKFKKNEKGFTLVEQLIYMGLFSILLVVLMSMFTSILDAHLESESTSSIIQDANYIMSRLTYDIHQSNAIALPIYGTTGVALRIINSATDFTYQAVGGKLQLTNNITGTTDQLNSNETTVSSATFTNLGNSPTGKNTIQIAIVLKSVVVRPGGNNSPKTFSTTVGIRK